MSHPPPTPPVEKFVTAGGLKIYRLRVEAFPDFYAHVHLVLGADVPTLVDAGSGWEQSNDDLAAAFDTLRAGFGEPVDLTDVGRVLVTHGHIDHFGGLMFVREHSPAPIGVHVLDRRILTHYEERVVVAARNLRVFLRRAGLSESTQSNLMQMYTFGKGFYRSVPVDFTLSEDEQLADVFRFYHVPGHCPGQVCIQIEDVLLTADHVLSRTTPHQSPESITRYVGLGHFLDSLGKVRDLPNVRIALGGHELPMKMLPERVDEIRRVHAERLELVLDMCAQPLTIKDISRRLFGETHGYNVLLALEEAGAHVEYLYQRGELVVSNVDELETEDEPALLYRRV